MSIDKEDQAREKAALEHIIFNEAAVCVTTVGLDKRFLACNRAFCEFLGYSEDELRRKTIADVTFPEDRAIGMEDICAVVAGEKKNSRVEKRYVRKDGAVVWGEVSINLVRDSQGQPLCLLPIIVDLTERKRAGEILKETRKSLEKEHDFFERLLDAPADTVFVFESSTGKAVRWNGVFREVSGYSDEEIASLKAPDSYYSQEDLSKAAAAIGALSKTGKGTVELSLITKDKRAIPFEYNASAVTDETGAPNYVIAIGRDITERKRAKEALIKSEQELRLTLDATTEGIWSWNFKTESLVFSPKYFTMLGYSPDEFPATYENWKALIHPDDLEAAVSVTERYLADKPDSYENEFRLKTKSGDFRWIHTVGRVVERDPNGEAVRMIGNHNDITERKRAEEALRDSEEKYRVLVEGTNDIVYAMSEDGILTYVSPQVSRYGWAAEELIGLSFLQVVAEEDRERVAAEYVDVIQKGKEFVSEFRINDKDGRPIWFSDNGKIQRDSQGNAAGTAGFLADITARKRAQAERENLEEQLRASQKMEAIGRLAGGVAHDFNNLLAVILSYTGFAMGSVRDGDPLKDDLLEVKKAAERAAALTRQLLAFSRKQVLQPATLDLNQIAAGVEKMLRRLLGEDIDFVQLLAPDLDAIHADPNQIEQVFMNLVVNARDAMPDGGKLTIETSNLEIDEEFAARHVAMKPGPYVLLAVTDTGQGMDEQTRARLFEPFFTTKEKGKGTGLGLSTVYGIVKQSGGNIWVDTEVGKGTTFKIYLPSDRSATAEKAIKSSITPMRSAGNETILVVEDEESLRKVAKRALEAAGYTVLTAANGNEAISTCLRHDGDIHLLLTDVVMPGMNGRALAQEVLKTRQNLQILYMSGYTDNAIVHHGVLDPGTQFISKPFTGDNLTRKVREVLDGGFANLG